VTKAEELVRSTTRAIASSVHDVPPLRLEPAPDELRSAGRGLPRPRGSRSAGRPGHWRAWLGPVTAVVAVVAVAIALVIVKDIPNGSGTPPLTGTLLRSWSAPAGQLTAQRAPVGDRQYTAKVLRWSADGRTLGFAWDAASIRVLDASAPNGNLLARSTALTAVRTATNTSADAALDCIAAQGWDLVDGGRAVACAGFWASVMIGGTGPGTASRLPSVGNCPSPPAAFAFVLKSPYGQYAGETRGLASVFACPSKVQAGDGAYLDWASPDGSILVGSLVSNGHSRFGIFRAGHFTPLPPLPISILYPTGMLVGTDAW
jgi:hypothetical protein